MNIVNIREISKSYNGLPALKRITLRVNKGELFGVIGPDGAGKTSLFRILTTLILPDTGSVEIDGLDGVKISYTLFSNNCLLLLRFE
jgi:ABC-2 type transport system ATP-binding protein